MSKFRVAIYFDQDYGVWEDDEVVFTGSLADCESYINLREQGYIT